MLCVEVGARDERRVSKKERLGVRPPLRERALLPTPLSSSYHVRPRGRRVVETVLRVVRVRPVAHVEAGGGGGQLAVAWRGRGRGVLFLGRLAFGERLKHVGGGDAAHDGECTCSGVTACGDRENVIEPVGARAGRRASG